MRNGFAFLFACLLAAVIVLSPLFCLCASPRSEAAVSQDVPSCHRKQAPQKQEPADCSHCQAAEIAKKLPDSPVKPAAVELAIITPVTALLEVAPANLFSRPADVSHTPQTASTLLSLHCALTV